MLILWSDNQDKVAIPDVDRLMDDVSLAIPRHAEVPPGSEVSVVLVDDREIARLNAAYRHKEGPTDVLSFPIGEEILDEQGVASGFLLGDVVISAERAVFQASELGHTLERELAFLLVHGVLHLLGHEHDEDMGSMGTITEEILAGIGLVR
jgi:probable rRNA maturation factor